jgi:cytochrome P450
MTHPCVEAYDPLDPAVVADPHPWYAALRQRAPVHFLPQRGFWVVTRHDDVVGILRRPELFSSAAMAAAVTRPRQFTPESDASFEEAEGISIVGTDGARHARLRGVLNRGFTPARIAALAPRVRAIARALSEPWLAASACEFLADFAVPFPAMVIAELLGVDPERRADFKRWADAALRGVFEPIDASEQQQVGACLAEMGGYFDAVIEARRASPADDLIGTLVRAEGEHGALTPTEVKTFVFTLLVAGATTTTYLLANAMHALIRHPDQWAAVAAHPGAVPALVEEALRWDGPVQMLLRTATRDVDVAGARIRQGETITPVFASANRDERIFPDPDRFDVTRRPREHLAFGHGIHFCLGAALARLEARVAFEWLLPRMLEPALDEEPVPWLASLVFRGPTRLRLRFGRA